MPLFQGCPLRGVPLLYDSWVTYHCILFSDINECDEDNGGCDGECVNNEGSFECNCDVPMFDTGYRLGSNGLSCDGEGTVLCHLS